MPTDDQFPALDDVMPGRFISPGREYAYIEAARVPAYIAEGWRQAPRSSVFIVDEAAYMVLERGTGRPRQGSYVPEVLVEADVVGDVDADARVVGDVTAGGSSFGSGRGKQSSKTAAEASA